MPESRRPSPYLPVSGRAGELIYIHQGTLFGLPFDLERLETRGTPTPLLQDVASDSSTGAGQFDFSLNGIFIYLSGRATSSGWPMIWLDSSGKTEPLMATGLNYSPRLSPDGKDLVFTTPTGVKTYNAQRDIVTRLMRIPGHVNKRSGKW